MRDGFRRSKAARWLAVLAGAALFWPGSLTLAGALDNTLGWIGSRFTPDGGYADCYLNNCTCVPAYDYGARLYVYFKNNSTGPLSVTNVLVNGLPFDNWPDYNYGCGYRGNVRWFMAWPPSVATGQVGAVWMYLPNQAAMLGTGGTAVVTLQTPAGEGSCSNTPLRLTDLWMPFIWVAPDLSRMTVYAANRGDHPLTLRADGGVRIDGQLVAGTLPKTNLAPGELIPVALATAGRLTKGRLTAFQIETADGGVVASAHQRVFPSSFGVTFWALASDLDKTDYALHACNLPADIPGSVVFQDEFISTSRMAPTTLVARVLTAWNAQGSSPTPLMLQNSSYGEMMIGDEIGDLHMSHGGNTSQDLMGYHVKPKPVWYLPQNAWSRSEGLGLPEDWGALEELQFEAFEAIGRGAKNIQWFYGMNLWEQGYQRGGASELLRGAQDMYSLGIWSNPIMWDHVGRISAVIQTLGPWLANSCEYTNRTQDGLGINLLTGGASNMIVNLQDYATPKAQSNIRFFQYGASDWPQRVFGRRTVRVPVPDYILPALSRAVLIDPFDGPRALTMQAVAGQKAVDLTVDELRTSALILIGSAADATAVTARWNSLCGGLSRADGFATVAAGTTLGGVADGWACPEAGRRARVTASNRLATTVDVFDLPLSLPQDEEFTNTQFRVTELDGEATNAVDFYIEPQREYESFADAGVLSRVTPGSGSNPRPAWSNGVLSYYFKPQASGNLPWLMSFTNPKPFGASWVPASYSSLILEAIFDQQRYSLNQFYLRITYDRNMDGVSDGIYIYYLDHSRTPMPMTIALSNGWNSYIADVRRGYQQLFPGQPPKGQWRFDLFSAVLSSATRTNETCWSIRRAAVGAGNSVRVQPQGGLAAGAARAYDVYFEPLSGGRLPLSPNYQSALAGATPNTNVVILATNMQTAGVRVEVSGAQVLIVPAARPTGVQCRLLTANGDPADVQYLLPATDGSFTATLPRAPLAGEKIALLIVQRNGFGNLLLFDAAGRPVAQTDSVSSSVWTQPVNGAPRDIDLSPDGRLTALAQSNQFVVLNAGGQPLWSTNVAGRAGFVRFSTDGARLYCAGNLSTNDWRGRIDAEASAWTVQAFAATNGVLLWSHRAADGIATLSGRTIFDLQAFPDGGLGYVEWNGNFVRLSATGAKLWSRVTGGYPVAIRPATNNFAAILGQYANIVTTSGFPLLAEASYLRNRVSDGPAAAIAILPDASRIAFAGNNLTLMTSNGTLVAQQYVGRNVRVLAAGTNLIVAGSCNGVLAAFDTNLVRRWAVTNGAAYVADLHMLPAGRGVLCAWEEFDYKPNAGGWRFRELLDTYNAAGVLTWRNTGAWRDQPFLSRLAVSSNGMTIALLTRYQVRQVSLSSRPAAPIIQPPGGLFIGSVAVTLGNGTPGTNIFYTLDGSAPGTSAARCASGFVLTRTNDTQVRAVTIDQGEASLETVAVFTRQTAAAAPQLSPPDTRFTNAGAVALSVATPNAVIRYTLNGTPPTPVSLLYTNAPVAVISNLELRAGAFHPSLLASPVVTGRYVVCAAGPVFTPPAGIYASNELVIALAAATPGAAIRYTLDGSNPDGDAMPYAQPLRLPLLDRPTVIRARATRPGLEASEIADAPYSRNVISLIPRQNLALWLKAETGVTASAGAVSAWADQSDRGFHATQNSASSQPRWLDAAANGRPAVWLDGSNDYLVVTNALQLNGCSNLTLAVVSMCFSNVVDAGGPGSSGDWMRYSLVSFGHRSLFVSPRQTRITYGIDASTNAVTDWTAVNLPAAQDTNYYLAIVRLELSNACVMVNDTNLQERALGGASIQPVGPPTNWIGQGFNSTYFPGAVAEIMLFTNTLSAADLGYVQLYLIGKYKSLTNAPVQYFAVRATNGPLGSVLPPRIDVRAGEAAAFTAQADAWCRAGAVWTNGTLWAAAPADTNGLLGLVWSNITGAATLRVDFVEMLAPAHGTPLRWLDRYGWTGNFDAAEMADADADGLRNWEEYVADTDPTNAASVLAANILAGPGAAIIRWPASTARLYSVQFSTNLPAGFGELPGAANLAGGQNAFTDTTHTAQDAIHYRVGVRKP